MDKKELIENEVEKTLQTADGIGKAEANPYLFSKIMNRMEEPGTAAKKFNFKIAIAVVVVCLITNLVLLFYGQNSTTGSNYYYYSSTDSVRTAQIKSFASEYSSTNSFYFY